MRCKFVKRYGTDEHEEVRNEEGKQNQVKTADETAIRRSALGTFPRSNAARDMLRTKNVAESARGMHLAKNATCKEDPRAPLTSVEGNQQKTDTDTMSRSIFVIRTRSRSTMVCAVAG